MSGAETKIEGTLVFGLVIVLFVLKLFPRKLGMLIAAYVMSVRHLKMPVHAWPYVRHNSKKEGAGQFCKRFQYYAHA